MLIGNFCWIFAASENGSASMNNCSEAWQPKDAWHCLNFKFQTNLQCVFSKISPSSSYFVGLKGERARDSCSLGHWRARARWRKNGIKKWVLKLARCLSPFLLISTYFGGEKRGSTHFSCICGNWCWNSCHYSVNLDKNSKRSTFPLEFMNISSFEKSRSVALLHAQWGNWRRKIDFVLSFFMQD